MTKVPKAARAVAERILPRWQSTQHDGMTLVPKACFVSPSQPESDRVNIGVLVVGAGRVGLYTVYRADFRGLSVAH